MRIPAQMAPEEMLLFDDSRGKRLPPSHYQPSRPQRSRSGGSGRRPQTSSPRGTRPHATGPRHPASDARGSDPAEHRRKPRPERRPTGAGTRAAATRSVDPRGPDRKKSIDERLAYYKSKYGEEFTAATAGRSGGPGKGKDGGRRGSSGPGDSSREPAGGPRETGPAREARGPRGGAPGAAGSGRQPEEKAEKKENRGVLGRLFRRKGRS